VTNQIVMMAMGRAALSSMSTVAGSPTTASQRGSTLRRSETTLSVPASSARRGPVPPSRGRVASA